MEVFKDKNSKGAPVREGLCREERKIVAALFWISLSGSHSFRRTGMLWKTVKAEEVQTPKAKRMTITTGWL